MEGATDQRVAESPKLFETVGPFSETVWFYTMLVKLGDKTDLSFRFECKHIAPCSVQFLVLFKQTGPFSVRRARTAPSPQMGSKPRSSVNPRWTSAWDGGDRGG